MEQAAVAIAAVMAVASVGGCKSDIFDVQVDLHPQVYTADFGQPTGAVIPSVACSPGDSSLCNTGQIAAVTGATDVPPEVSLACDASTSRCYAQATARSAVTVDVLMDDNFTSKVERQSISLVRVADLAYTVPTNTLTFNVPEVRIYTGSPGTMSENDAGVLFVASSAAIPAGTTFTDPQHLTVDDASPARAFMEDQIKNEQPFVLLFVVTPRLESGSAVPAGAFEVDLAPHLLIGLPR